MALELLGVAGGAAAGAESPDSDDRPWPGCYL